MTKHPLQNFYPSMFEKTPSVPKDASSGQRMYPTMAGMTEANQKREAGWRRAQPEHVTLARMYPTMVGKYDIVFDDPKHPEQGAWIRTRAPKEGDLDYG